MSLSNKLFVGIFISQFFVSCQYFNSTEPKESTVDSPKITAPTFDENLAYKYIEQQVAFGTRVPSTAPHELCANFLLDELKKLSDTSYYQKFETVTFDGKKHASKNIIAKINPTASHRILLSAHWDTRPIADQDIKDQTKPILGANDGGSGVGVILAILQAIKSQKLDLGIDVVLFDIEDYGQPENSKFLPMKDSYCLGSQFWASNFSESIKPRFGINLDMVGGKSATFYKESISMLYAPNLVNRVWGIAEKLNYSNIFVSSEGTQITDDHFYVNSIAAIPMIDLIHTNPTKGFADYWHTHQDNMASVDKSTLKAVGNTLIYLIYEENSIKD